jgi:predicted permease
MGWIKGLAARTAGLFGKGWRDAELQAEIESHLALHADENLRRGMNESEARRNAVLRLGGVEAMKEEYRERRGLPWVEALLQDARYTLRSMRRSPGFVAAAVATLALGIGANAAIFSLVDGVLLRPLPYPHPEQIVRVYDVEPNYGVAPMSYPEYADWREKQQVFQTLAAGARNDFVLSGAGAPEQISALFVSGNYLPLLGVEPVLGRNFEANEESLAGPPVALITHSFWQSHFGGDAKVLGRTLTLDDKVYSIIGVLPPTYEPLQRGDILIGLRFKSDVLKDRGLHFLNIYGRLRDGLSVEEARRDLLPLAEQLQKERSTKHGIQVFDLKEDLTQGSSTPLALMFGAVGFILLIACANVANLLLARAAGRHREMAVRTALGAGKWRLIRQLITESTVLSLAGGALGILVGSWTIAGLVRTLGPRLPRANEVGINVNVLMFTFGVAIVTGIAFGLAPVKTLLRSSLAASLGEGGRGAVGSGSRQRSSLVVAEVALAIVLMAGGGLVLRSFWRLLNVSKGFDADHVLTFDVGLSPNRYSTPEQQTQFFTEFRHKLAGLPGVEASGLTSSLPLTGIGVTGGIDIKGRAFAEDERPNAGKRIAGPGYFRAMHIPILKGREFTDEDVKGSPPVAIVNESFARKYFAGQDPLSQYVGFAWGIVGLQQVVGVVANVKQDSLAAQDQPEVYVCYTQRPSFDFTFVVRTKGDPGAMTSAIRSVLYSLDASTPIADVNTMDEVVSLSVRDQRASVLLLGSLGGLALLLTAIGIYGVLAYDVAQQTREIGVRMALGASVGNIWSMVIRRGVLLVGIGCAIGLAAALALTRLMTSLLFSVKPNDPITFAGVTVVLFAVALIACWMPAWRATRVDPMVALRYE